MDDVKSKDLFFPNMRLNDTSRERLFMLLTQTLSSTPPSHPLCIHPLLCGILGLASMDFSTAIEQHTFATRLVLEHPTFVNAMTSFVLTRRTQEQLDELKHTFFRPNACQCDLADPLISGLHKWRFQGGTAEGFTTPVHAMVQVGGGIFWLLNYMLATLKGQQLDRLCERQQLRPKDRGFQTLVEYIDKKPRFMMQAASQWFLSTNAKHCVGFLTHLISHYPERFLPVIDSIRPNLPLELVRHVRTILQETDGQQTQHIDPKVIDKGVEYTDCLHILTRTLGQSPETEKLLSHHHKQIYYDIRQIFNDYGADPLALFRSKFLPASLLPTLAVSVIYIYQHFAELERELGPEPHPWVQAWMSLTMIDQDRTSLYTRVSAFMSIIRGSGICANLACRKVPETSLKPFNRCARCKVVCYCSPDCQRVAWRSANLPHKQVCSTWATLTEAWPRHYALQPAEVDIYHVSEELLKEAAMARGFDEDKMRQYLQLTGAFKEQITGEVVL